MNKKTNIKNLTEKDFFELIQSQNQPGYRAEQIRLALFKHKISKFEQITNLPKSFREYLSENYEINSLKLNKYRQSHDGSIKFLFDLVDGNAIEAVYMPWYDNDEEGIVRETLCISTMAGCSVNCAFCATGKLGFKRNLEVAEIIDQVIEVERLLGTKLTNIVLMGMGEPLLNYNNTVRALEILIDPNYEMFSRRKITLSTSGIAPRIKQFAQSPRPVKLAISLHATDNKTRDLIMPINKSFNLNILMESIEFYYKTTKIPIMYEYIIFEKINDSIEDVKRLAKIARRVPSRVNIIPFNDISFTKPQGFAATLKPASLDKMQWFANELRTMGIPVIVRDTFGGDIEGACGQLALSDKLLKFQEIV